MASRITATPAALDLVERLRAQHGPPVIHISGGCCDGSSPMCLRATDLPPAPHDVRLGDVGGTPVVIDAEQDARWNRPGLRLDAVAGPAEGFSLDGLTDVHLVLADRGIPADR
jgi:uncharacterized protein